MDDGLDPDVVGVRTRTYVRADAVVVEVGGELDSQAVPELAAAVTDALSGIAAVHLVLDLSQVVFFGSAGIAFLTQTSSEAGAKGVDLRVVAGADGRVHRVLEMMGLTRLLAVFPTSERALRGE